MNYLLSIVVPTKNRYEYLKGLIVTFNSFNYENVELIIQDNSDENAEILNIINLMPCKTIKYFYNKRQISMVENSELAIHNSTGEYVCFIGDDDCVSSQIVNLISWLKNKNIEACLCPMAKFNWSDMVYKYHQFPNLKYRKGKGFAEEINIENELDVCIKHGATSMGRLPKVYHGIVARKALDRIHDLAGSFFPGPSPDMANAIALCFVIKKCIYIDLPFIISGYSYKSGMGMGARRKHRGEIKDMSHLPSDTYEIWEKTIPKIWTGATIYAESTIKALKAMRQNEIINNFNFPYLYAYFICFDPVYLKMLKPFVKRLSTKIKVFRYCCSITMVRGIIFMKNLLYNKLNLSTEQKFNNILDIQEATNKVDDYLKSFLSKQEIDFY
jgi:glycosyltransferase involved in cell wall biosynthesis